jgi:hypothetical protein
MPDSQDRIFKWQELPVRAQGENLPTAVYPRNADSGICVGGIYPDGSFWHATTLPGRGIGQENIGTNPQGPEPDFIGELSIFAVAACDLSNWDFEKKQLQGTSCAAPLVVSVATFNILVSESRH